MASSDLGSLGAREGSPVNFDWVMPNLAPLLLPWLIILGLLALKPNRNAAAWLIWLPLGGIMVLTLVLPATLPSGADFFVDAITALAMGLTSVLLLADYLRRQHGFLTFLCVLLALAVVSLLAAVSRVSGMGMVVELFQVGILLGLGALVTAAGLGLAGLICRRRYRPLGLYLWLFLLLAGMWLLVTVPFFLVAEIASNGGIRWSEFFVPVLSVAIVHFAILLPFLILSSASPFYRQRLKALLHVKPEVPPTLNAAEPTLV